MSIPSLEELREKRAALVAQVQETRQAAEAEERDLTEDELRTSNEKLDDVDKIDARIASEERAQPHLKPTVTQRDVLGEDEPRHAVPKGSLKAEAVYRPDMQRERSFFRDLLHFGKNAEATERLTQHDREARAANTTGSTDGGGFIPPVFLGELYAEVPRQGRPFADALGSRPLMAQGMTLTIPRITTGTAVAEQATQNNAVTSQAIVDSPLSVAVNTIAGYNDVSQQLFDRSEPGIDQIIFSDLRAAYDAKLDTLLLSGSGSSGQHTGIRAVSSINTVQYTDASPTAAELVPKVYDAVQKIASNRYLPATHVVMHPRRAAWLASNLSSTFPLFQQGGFLQAVGGQDGGAVMTIAGLPVVADANIATNYSDGGNTNEDEIYVVHAPDLILWEGPLQARVDPNTVGLNLTVRLVLYAYSAFASGRQATSISKLYGSGLATPTF